MASTIDPFDVLILVDRNATVAEVRIADITATGSSKREPGEVFDVEVGHRLALSRALRAAAGQLEAKALERLATLPSGAMQAPVAHWPADLKLGFSGMAQWLADAYGPAFANIGRLGHAIVKAQRDADRYARWRAKIEACHCPPDAELHDEDCASWPGEPRTVGGRHPAEDERAAGEELVAEATAALPCSVYVEVVDGIAPCGQPTPCPDHPLPGTVKVAEPGRCTALVGSEGGVEFLCGATMPCVAHPSLIPLARTIRSTYVYRGQIEQAAQHLLAALEATSDHMPTTGHAEAARLVSLARQNLANLDALAEATGGA
jgi:hypothetical protein